MSYSLSGKLCGYICSECPETLSGVTVRLYRTQGDENVTRLAVANPKETLAILDEDTVARKAQLLFAEAKTDEEGKFAFNLDEKKGYGGEAFEVDVYCGTVPHRKATRKPPKPVQFSITTLQPVWRQTEEGYAAVWQYCVPTRFWCSVRARFGAWTVCGKVMDCKSQVPVAGVTVHAFDTDWIQDDPLGSAVSDGSGKFRIDYLTSDFQKTPFSPLFNIELVGGPDLYFTAESGGSTLLQEPPSRGRQPDRENSGPCVCVTLCVEAPAPPVNNPWFTHIGDFHIYGDIDSTSGLTNTSFAGHGGPGYGFFAAMKLKGFCPKTSPSGPPDPMRYRFLYEHPANPGVQVPITGASLLIPVVVGARLILWKIFSDSFEWTFQSIVVAGSGATPDPTPQPVGPGPWGAPPDHVIVPDADGWIPVDPNALDNGFYGPLVRFNSPAAVPGGAAPGNGAGNPVSDPKDGVGVKLIFEAGPISGAASFSNDVDNVHINNWDEVRLLGIQQFGGGGSPCSPLSSNLDALYTVDHELLASWQLSILSASPSAPGQVEGGTGPRGGSGVHHENISAWQSCSYQVWLTTRRALTDGETDDGANSNLLTFCK